MPTPANAKILSDPRNLPEITQALDKRIAVADQKMKANDQMLPVWMRLTDGAMDKTEKYEMAKMDLVNAQGAKQEIGMYRQDLAAYDAAHPPQAAAAQKSGPPVASPSDIKAVQTELARREAHEGPVSGKWNKETNAGLNQLVASAQSEGQQVGIYKGALDNKYVDEHGQFIPPSALLQVARRPSIRNSCRP